MGHLWEDLWARLTRRGGDHPSHGMWSPVSAAEDLEAGLLQGQDGGFGVEERSFTFPRRFEADIDVTVDPAVGRSSLDEEVPLPPQKFCSNFVSTTKYNPFTFLFQNLAEQFMRFANMYFLLITILSSFPQISPIGPLTSVLAVGFVLSVTMIKEGYEDWLRYKSDQEVNRRMVEVYRSEILTSVKWDNVVVGDVVVVRAGQPIPADVILCCSSDSDDICYIETANLDGETSHKLRQCILELGSEGDAADQRSRRASSGGSNSESHLHDALSQVSGSVHSQGASKELEDIQAVVEVVGHPARPVGPQSLLPRESVLKNCQWVIGVVCFTGVDTKVMLNATAGQSVKRSSIEKQINTHLFFIFSLEWCMCLFIAIASGIWTSENQVAAWYLELPREKTLSERALDSVKDFFTSVILLNIMIPMSLYVSMEVVKVAQAYLISNDVQMYDEQSDTPARARTSNLNEQLGMIEYVFADKTGTLTDNKMDFVACSVGRRVYVRSLEVDLTSSPRPQQKSSDLLIASTSVTLSEKFASKGLGEFQLSDDERRFVEFWVCVGVCHTASAIESEDGTIEYHSSSPDELALLEGARRVGVVLKSRVGSMVTLDVFGETRVYEVLETLEFNNYRKRMSVVCRLVDAGGDGQCDDNGDSDVHLFCKGADSVIFERIRQDGNILQCTETHLTRFANEGMRTLCVASKTFSANDISDWLKAFSDVSLSVRGDRTEKMEVLAEDLEKELTLLGSTAIEDKLQDGVPECIDMLRQGGMKVWMLTGDKLETAVNIAYSCKLFSEHTEVLHLNGPVEAGRSTVELEAMLSGALTQWEEADSAATPSTNQAQSLQVDRGIVFEGSQLVALCDRGAADLVYRVLSRCHSVVCCRVSPLQKAMVVDIMRSNEPLAVTLAIGDGANDVEMIRSAHVGVGINGKEGSQAARSSDYSIAQFRFLRKLLFVHGRWSLKRISKLVQYMFYKNVAIACVQFWFSFFDGFSGQSFFNDFLYQTFNIFFTSLPVVALAVFDQDLDADTLLRAPSLYPGKRWVDSFNNTLFWGWIAVGVWQSLIFFYSFIWIYRSPGVNGKTVDLVFIGVVCYSLVIVTTNCQIALMTSIWTIWNHIVTWGSIVLFFVFIVVYGSMQSVDPELYGVWMHLYQSPSLYFVCLLAPALCMTPGHIYKSWRQNFNPLPHHEVMRETAKLKKMRGKNSPRMEKRRSRDFSAYRLGYAYSH